MNSNDDILENLFFMEYGDYFDKNNQCTIKEILQWYKDANCTSDIKYMKLKHPTYMLFISIFFGWLGIDRILLNYKKKAIKKILITVSIITILYICHDLIYETESEGLLRYNVLFFLIFLVTFMFLHLVMDIYNVYNDTYQYNLNLLLEHIKKHNSKIDVQPQQ